ncbi:hypothetical protein M0804_007665 [Polistes exclamans]|nr:hypothetical protein M0804_007665 [Polistes exclamans]
MMLMVLMVMVVVVVVIVVVVINYSNTIFENYRTAIWLNRKANASTPVSNRIQESSARKPRDFSCPGQTGNEHPRNNLQLYG